MMLDIYLTMILASDIRSLKFYPAISVSLDASNGSSELFQSVSFCLKSYLLIPK